MNLAAVARGCVPCRTADRRSASPSSQRPPPCRRPRRPPCRPPSGNAARPSRRPACMSFGIAPLCARFWKRRDQARVLVVHVPVERIHGERALRGLQAERGHVVDAEDQRRRCSASPAARIPPPASSSWWCRRPPPRARRPAAPEACACEQEGREVRCRDRRAHAADHLAAVLQELLGRLPLQVVAEGVVGGDEEPGLAAALRPRPWRASARRPRCRRSSARCWASISSRSDRSCPRPSR